VRIYQGDVFAHGPDSDQFQITRKPAETLLEMLQLVHDTRYVPQEFIRYGYPDCWYAPEESAMRGGTAEGYWSRSEDRQEYRLNTGGRTELKWLHYRHLTPGDDDWSRLQQGRWSGDAKPSLITDFYAYNAGVYADSRPSGFHWVGDLCVECEVQVLEARGELLFDLVEGGRHHVCRIDLGSGQAELSIDGGTVAFQADNAPFLTAPTPVGGARSYAIRFANVDDQLLLWVDGRRIRFNEADELWDGTYAVTDRESVVPRWSSRDAGDLEPARIGGRDVNVVVSDIRLLRDVYYIAVDEATVGLYDYDLPIYSPHSFHGELTRLFQSPLDWRLTSVFAARQKTEFRLGADDFFPLGDNSPESKDARIWHHDAPPHSPRFVKRDLLVGRPFVIFWPHPWPAGTRLLPVVPNFRRFKVIR
jgi:signal peptidase I